MSSLEGLLSYGLRQTDVLMLTPESTDNLTASQRSRCMSRIRARDSRPEMIVRRLIHSMGYRYVLHRKDLPGCPDIVLPRHLKIVFVHGCFWHRHRCRFGNPRPKHNSQYWSDKFQRNVERDRRVRRKLRQSGWRVLVLWECQLRDEAQVRRRLERFLERV